MPIRFGEIFKLPLPPGQTWKLDDAQMGPGSRHGLSTSYYEGYSAYPLRDEDGDSLILRTNCDLKSSANHFQALKQTCDHLSRWITAWADNSFAALLDMMDAQVADKLKQRQNWL